MERLGRGRITALFSVAAFVLAGCGGQTGNPVPQGATPQARVHMASGSSGTLLYVTSHTALTVFSYPAGRVVLRHFRTVRSHLFVLGSEQRQRLRRKLP